MIPWKTTIFGGTSTQLTASCKIVLLGLCLCLMPFGFSATADVKIDADGQYSFGEHLLGQGRYLEAAQELERFVFFFPGDRRVDEARLKIARSFMKAARYQQALNAARKLADSDPERRIKVRTYFIISRCYQAMGAATQAIATLHNLDTLMQDPDISDQVNYRLGWIYLENGDWTRARIHLKKISALQRPGLGVDPILADLNQADNLPRKNPRIAGALSIVPGAGQLYCGRYQDALIAFGINTGLIWAAWESFDQGHEALGTMISFVALGFYMGNIYGAVGDAHKFNRQQARNFSDWMYKKHLAEKEFSYFHSRQQQAGPLVLGLQFHF